MHKGLVCDWIAPCPSPSSSQQIFPGWSVHPRTASLPRGASSTSPPRRSWPNRGRASGACERVLEQALNRPLERPGAVGRVPTCLSDHLLRGIGQLELEASVGEALPQAVELQLDDLAELFPRERLELDDLVDPVQELGAEV